MEKGESQTTHERLVVRQTTDELRRKQIKAAQPGIWTQEDIDLGKRLGKEIAEKLQWD